MIRTLKRTFLILVPMALSHGDAPIRTPILREGDVWVYRQYSAGSHVSSLSWRDYVTDVTGFRIDALRGEPGKWEVTAFLQAATAKRMYTYRTAGDTTREESASSKSKSATVDCTEPGWPYHEQLLDNAGFEFSSTRPKFFPDSKCNEIPPLGIGMKWWKDTVIALHVTDDFRPMGDSLDTLIHRSGRVDGLGYYYSYYRHPSTDGWSYWFLEQLWVDSLGLLEGHWYDRSTSRAPQYESRLFLESHNGRSLNGLRERIMDAVASPHNHFYFAPWFGPEPYPFPEPTLPEG